MAQWVENPPAMQETQELKVQSLSQEDSLEEKIATHSSILAWKNGCRLLLPFTIHRRTMEM